MEQDETLSLEQDKPPSPCTPAQRWLVGVIANLKGETPLPVNGPADAGAEFDREETIEAIRSAIESVGHQTIFLPANPDLPLLLREQRPDICFNLAEGIGGDGREAQVPALLEMMSIPYTGSRVVANAVSLDKTLTKRLWQQAGLPIAPFQEFSNPLEPLNAGLDFPLFVKPAREGTGMGVDEKAIVWSLSELRERVEWITRVYRQPALVETFLSGREFTVGVLGRKDAVWGARRPEIYTADGFHLFPITEVVNGETSCTPGVYSHIAKTIDLDEEGATTILCPAPLKETVRIDLHTLSIRAHESIGALDFSRVDIRMNAEGNPCLMEINTLPGLTPGFSDLCLMANAEGLSYRDLVLEILYLAASRTHLYEMRIPSFINTVSVFSS